MGGDQKVVGSDGGAGSLKRGAHVAIDGICGRFEWQNRQDSKHGIELRGKPGRAILGGAVAQLGRYDDAGGDGILADFGDLRRYTTLGMADEIGDGVGVEKKIRRSQVDRLRWMVDNRREIFIERLERREQGPIAIAGPRAQ